MTDHQHRLTAARDAVVEAAKRLRDTEFSSSWREGSQQHETATQLEAALAAALGTLEAIEQETPQ